MKEELVSKKNYDNTKSFQCKPAPNASHWLLQAFVQCTFCHRIINVQFVSQTESCRSDLSDKIPICCLLLSLLLKRSGLCSRQIAN